MNEPESLNSQIAALRAENERQRTRLSSMRDQAWAGIRKYAEEIEQHANDPETPDVVKMALFSVLADLQMTQGSSTWN